MDDERNPFHATSGRSGIETATLVLRLSSTPRAASMERVRREARDDRGNRQETEVIGL